MNRVLLAFLLVLAGCPTPTPPTSAVCSSQVNCGVCTSIPVCGWCASSDATVRGCGPLTAPCSGMPIAITENCPSDATGGLK